MLGRLVELCVVVVQSIGIVLILFVGTVCLLYVLHDAVDHSCVALPKEILFGKELILVVHIVVGLVEAVVDDRDALAAAQQLLRGTQQQAVVGRVNVVVVGVMAIAIVAIVVVVIVAVAVVVVAVVVAGRGRELRQLRLQRLQRLRRTVAAFYGCRNGGYDLALAYDNCG